MDATRPTVQRNLQDAHHPPQNLFFLFSERFFSITIHHQHAARSSSPSERIHQADESKQTQMELLMCPLVQFSNLAILSIFKLFRQLIGHGQAPGFRQSRPYQSFLVALRLEQMQGRGRVSHGALVFLFHHDVALEKSSSSFCIVSKVSKRLQVTLRDLRLLEGRVSHLWLCVALLRRFTNLCPSDSPASTRRGPVPRLESIQAIQIVLGRFCALTTYVYEQE